MSDDVETSVDELKKDVVRALLLAQKAVDADHATKYDVCVTYYDEAAAILSRLLQSGSLVYHLSDNERDLLAEKSASYQNRSHLIKDAINVVEASHAKDLTQSLPDADEVPSVEEPEKKPTSLKVPPSSSSEPSLSRRIIHSDQLLKPIKEKEKKSKKDKKASLADSLSPRSPRRSGRQRSGTVAEYIPRPIMYEYEGTPKMRKKVKTKAKRKHGGSVIVKSAASDSPGPPPAVPSPKTKPKLSARPTPPPPPSIEVTRARQEKERPKPPDVPPPPAISVEEPPSAAPTKEQTIEPVTTTTTDTNQVPPAGWTSEQVIETVPETQEEVFLSNSLSKWHRRSAKMQAAMVGAAFAAFSAATQSEPTTSGEPTGDEYNDFSEAATGEAQEQGEQTWTQQSEDGTQYDTTTTEPYDTDAQAYNAEYTEAEQPYDSGVVAEQAEDYSSIAEQQQEQQQLVDEVYE